MNSDSLYARASMHIILAVLGFAVFGETACAQDNDPRGQRVGGIRPTQFPAWLLDAHQAGFASTSAKIRPANNSANRAPTWLPENFKQGWTQAATRPHVVQRPAAPAPTQLEPTTQPKFAPTTQTITPKEPPAGATTKDFLSQLPSLMIGLTHIPPWFWGLIAVGVLGFMVRSKPSKKSAFPRSEPSEQEETSSDFKIGVEIIVDGRPNGRMPPITRNALIAEGNRVWVRQNQCVKIGGLDIYGPLYCGSKLTPFFEDGQQDNCLVDPNLKIGARPDDVGQSMDYWPSYANMSPGARRAFLNWMASDRSDPKAYIGYVFLYFYGIERRLVLENSSDEREALRDEIKRLLRVYGSNRSFKRYANELLFAAALLDQEAPDKTPNLFEPAGGNLPSSVKVAIGRKLKEQSVIEAEWLLSWTMAHPQTKVRTPARRVFGEVARLFIAKYRTQFPAGLRLRNDVGPCCEFIYRAASSTFEIELSELSPSIPDPSFHEQGLEIGRAILESCTIELEAYSRIIGKSPELANRLEALSQLPKDLRTSAIERAEFIQHIRAIADGMGRSSLNQLYGQISNGIQKVTPARYRELCDVLARCSIGVAPDPRFSITTTVPNDVVLFPLLQPIEQIQPTDKYRPTLLALALGAMVAQADNDIGESEKRLLIEQAAHCGKQLPQEEATRLIADLRWLNANPLEIKSVKSRLKNASEKDRENIAKLLVDVAIADGQADRSTIVLLEKLYKHLDLKLERLYVDLNVGIKIPPANNDDSNVRPLPIRPIWPNETPKAPDGAKSILDDIRKESEDLTHVLNSILDDSEDVAHVKTDSRKENPAESEIDVRYLDFVRLLIQKPEWKNSDFNRLAREHGLMAGAVIEELNDWSHKAFDDTLIEDGDPLFINCDLVSAYFSEAAE